MGHISSHDSYLTELEMLRAQRLLDLLLRLLLRLHRRPEPVEHPLERELLHGCWAQTLVHCSRNDENGTHQALDDRCFTNLRYIDTFLLYVLLLFC